MALTDEERRMLSTAGSIRSRQRMTFGGPPKKIYRCDWCASECLGGKALKSHRDLCEKRPIFPSDLPGIGLQCCKWCGLDGISYKALWVHLRECAHRSCEHCGAGGFDRKAWLQHQPVCDKRPTRQYVRTAPIVPRAPRPRLRPPVPPEALAGYRNGLTLRELKAKFGVRGDQVIRAHHWPDIPPPRKETGKRSSPAQRRFETWQGHFLSLVDTSGGPWACWPWLGLRSQRGYGKFSDVRRGPRSATASRIALEAKLGRPLGDGMLACHTCDNPPCCNPRHLFEGTDEDNVRDMVSKGRRVLGPHGEAHPSRKLDSDQVRRLRVLYEAGVKVSALSEQFGISKNQVRKVAQRVYWKDVA